MTEYDYSPDALERHLAKLDGIAKWVDKTKQHEPVNPFAPLPGEHAHPSDSYPQSPPRSPPQIQQQPYGYPYSYQYQYPYQTASQQLYYPTQPQHAFYATPQGIISPTYSAMHTSSSSRHHRPHHSSSRRSSGSRSHRPSPTQSFLPMALGPRSYSTPPLQTSPYGSSYVIQQPLMQAVGVAQPMYPLTTGYTTMPVSGSTPDGSPYSAYSVPQAPVSRGRSKSRSRSESYSASHSSSHYSGRSKSRSRSYSIVYPSQSQPQVQTSQNVYGTTMGAYGSQSAPYLQPTPDQPVVVPINGGVGGYVVVPAKGQVVTVVVSVWSCASLWFGRGKGTETSGVRSSGSITTFLTRILSHSWFHFSLFGFSGSLELTNRHFC